MHPDPWPPTPVHIYNHVERTFIIKDWLWLIMTKNKRYLLKNAKIGSWSFQVTPRWCRSCAEEEKKPIKKQTINTFKIWTNKIVPCSDCIVFHYKECRHSEGFRTISRADGFYFSWAMGCDCITVKDARQAFAGLFPMKVLNFSRPG